MVVLLSTLFYNILIHDCPLEWTKIFYTQTKLLLKLQFCVLFHDARGPGTAVLNLRSVNLDKEDTTLFSLISNWYVTFYSIIKVKSKGKADPLKAWCGPEGSRKLRFPDFMTTAQDGGKVNNKCGQQNSLWTFDSAICVNVNKSHCVYSFKHISLISVPKVSPDSQRSLWHKKLRTPVLIGQGVLIVEDTWSRLRSTGN
jgi:hypothetical protein